MNESSNPNPGLCEHFKEVFFPKQKPLDLEEQTKTNELKALEEEIEREIKIIIDRQKHVDQLNHKRELLKRSLKGLEKQKDDLFQNVFKGFAKMLTEDDKKMEIEADSEPVLDEPLSFFETSDTLNTSISSNTSTAPEPSLKRKAHLIANDSFGKKKKVLEDQSRSMQMLGASLRANAGKVTNGSPTTPGMQMI